jgi:type IV fimbrial biogenesis protein FimT
VPKRKRGFSLIELMVVLSILAIFATMAAPSFRQVIQQLRIESERTALQNVLMLARSEAVKRGTRSWVKGSIGGWGGPITAFIDTNGDGVLQPTEFVIAVLPAMQEIVIGATSNLSNGVGYTETGTILPSKSQLDLRAPNWVSQPGAFVGAVCFETYGRTNVIVPTTPNLTAPLCP